MELANLVTRLTRPVVRLWHADWSPWTNNLEFGPLVSARCAGGYLPKRRRHDALLLQRKPLCRPINRH